MSNKTATPELTMENFEQAIAKFQRKTVLTLLKGGILTTMEEAERIAAYQKLTALRSMDIIDFLSKQQPPFPAEMLQQDFNVYQNKNFVKEVLGKYNKKFNFAIEEECAKLFLIACAVDDEKTVKTLIRQKKAADCYSALGSASLIVFSQVSDIATDQLHDDERVQLYVNAALSEEWEAKINYLLNQKIDVFVKNTSEKTVVDLLAERVKTYKYGNDKKGRLQKLQEEQTLKYLQKIQFDLEHPQEPPFQIKKMVVIGIVCVILAAVIGTVAGYVYVNKTSSTSTSTSTTTELSVEEETEDYSE